MIELVKDPEAEIAVVVGQSKVIQTKRTLTRVVRLESRHRRC